VQNSRTRILIIPLTLVFLVVLVQTSWIGDDAFITMRVVDNFVHGYGLRWNVLDRVQVFTHPLWLFLLSGAYALTHDAQLTTIGVSVLVTLAVVVLFFLKVCQNDFGLLLAWSVLILSKAFIDYSASGLENPATHLFLLIFVILYLQAERPFSDRRVFLLALMAGLATFNRMDTLLFYIPALLAVFWSRRSWRTLGLLLAGFGPFIIWEVFAVIYYGFPLPNPYYAKLGAGVPLGELISQGFLYYLNSLGWNSVTLAVIAISLVLTFRLGRRDERWLAWGVVLYLLYILRIGGDFMSGRFFTTPLLLCTILLVRQVQDSPRLHQWVWLGLVLMLGLLLSPVKSFGNPAIETVLITNPATGIADERAGYYRSTSLLFRQRGVKMKDYWDVDGHPFERDQLDVRVENGIGMAGFFNGPNVHYIDGLGVVDPLTARLPMDDHPDWRIAHFERTTPAGYPETVASGQNQIEDPSLAAYYDHLRLIIRGDLWSAARWQAIWKMNTGGYDYLIREYESRQSQ
jgi:arabinofuranosyltransferase